MRMRRSLQWIRRAAAIGACSLVMLPMSAAPVLAAGTTFPVQAGGGTPDQAVQADLFFPGTITVDVGDSISWADGSGEAHTISFGTPPSTPGGPDLAPAGSTSYDGSAFTSSGLLLPIPGTKYTLTFSKEGTYNYQCLIHPVSMHGTVVVQAAGAAYPTSQTTYKAASDPQLTAAITAGEAALASQPVTSKANGDGTTTYFENGGWGDGKSYTLERFGAQNLAIHSGDTVVWTQKDPNENHTVTFLNNGQDVPFTLPDGSINPQAAAPAGGKVYSGSGYVNSGLLVPNQAYSLTFDKAGTYQYECLIHDDLGMKAEITVSAAAASAPAQVPAQMPNTGAGGGSTSLAWLGLMLFGLLGLGTGVQKLAKQRG
jgi:plastocyanin